MRYNYSIVRVWQLPVEELLAGGIATLPLAPIADVPESDLPRVISRMRERIEAEPKDEQQDLWASTYFPMGAKYPGSLTNQLLKGIGTVFESSTLTKPSKKGVAQGELSGRLQQARGSLLTLEARLGA
ncbi:MAG: hypothetical protein H7145_21450, partial [Akkermansiaceae bacterium]|nr:hypothetical protein [Armatimonadota bacterium]